MTKGVWAVLLSSTVLAASPQAMAGHPRTIVGRVADIRPDGRADPTDETAETLVIKTQRGGEVSVSVDRRTRYLKWVTQKPLQQDTRADASFLRVGRLVAAEVSVTNAYPVARVVRIAME